MRGRPGDHRGGRAGDLRAGRGDGRARRYGADSRDVPGRGLAALGWRMVRIPEVLHSGYRSGASMAADPLDGADAQAPATRNGEGMPIRPPDHNQWESDQADEAPQPRSTRTGPATGSPAMSRDGPPPNTVPDMAVPDMAVPGMAVPGMAVPGMAGRRSCTRWSDSGLHGGQCAWGQLMRTVSVSGTPWDGLRNKHSHALSTLSSRRTCRTGAVLSKSSAWACKALFTTTGGRR